MAENGRDGAVPVAEVSRLTERLFREEAGRLVATLTRHLGVDHLQLAEDVVQEALARALRVWPFYGVPQNPAAWLTQTAKNLALDVIRREKTFAGKEDAIVTWLHQTAGKMPDTGDFEEGEIRDDRLRLLFVCCHPRLAQEAQVALALKTLCGFSTLEISKAFLTTEASIAKRLTRAKQRLREDGISFEIPAATELSARLEAVLQTVYLLFSEGYKASGGERLVREELCLEALRLMAFLVEHPAGDRPHVHALLALMLFNAARLATRVGAEGNLLRLEEQDRAKWDAAMIGRGMRHLSLSAAGEALSEYHLQAGIAACHCAATEYAATDWPQILALYDRLVKIDGSPVASLNRAIAVAHVHGPAAGVAAVEAISDREKLASYTCSMPSWGSSSPGWAASPRQRIYSDARWNWLTPPPSRNFSASGSVIASPRPVRQRRQRPCAGAIDRFSRRAKAAEALLPHCTAC